MVIDSRATCKIMLLPKYTRMHVHGTEGDIIQCRICKYYINFQLNIQQYLYVQYSFPHASSGNSIEDKSIGPSQMLCKGSVELHENPFLPGQYLLFVQLLKNHKYSLNPFTFSRTDLLFSARILFSEKEILCGINQFNPSRAIN